MTVFIAALTITLALLLTVPAAAQQYTTCSQGAPGQIVCQQQPVASGKRIAIVAAAAAGVAVVIAIGHHKKHQK